MSWFSIAEWFGVPLAAMAPSERKTFARAALQETAPPPCPFQKHNLPCSKKGGVCSIQSGNDAPVITCPRRFEQDNLLPLWLADLVGFQNVYVASEVPFMRSPDTGRAAGRIDLVIANDEIASTWFGLEVQAVYFSGKGMEPDFRLLLESDAIDPPRPTERRRSDWRSSSAKRLMPQLQVKGPDIAAVGNQACCGGGPSIF